MSAAGLLAVICALSARRRDWDERRDLLMRQIMRDKDAPDYLAREDANREMVLRHGPRP